MSTENGAVSETTTNSAVLNLFFKLLRGVTLDTVNKLMQEAWAENPELTTKAVFHLRDCRGGKGEKEAYSKCLRWLISNHPNTVLVNLEHVPFYGTYKDLLTVFAETPLEINALVLLATTLANDIDTLLGADETLANADKTLIKRQRIANVSLAAKWAPTEGGSLDRKFRFSKKLIGLLRTRCKPKLTTCVNSKEYRVLCTRLRSHLDVVETHMCAGDWESINFEHVPSAAMKKYHRAFGKLSEYKEYLSRVASGVAKIHARVHCNVLVKHYLDGGEYSETIEAQWKQIIKDTQVSANMFPLVDVSGSMEGQPLEVAISLGLLLSEISTNFKGQVMTFEARPQIVKINTEDSLMNKVMQMKRLPWGGNTDLQAALTLLLNANVIPQTLFIFSDMQFDAACNVNQRTNFQALENKYRDRGLVRPNIVFWNLRANTVDFPTQQHTSRCALVSGFSQDLLALFFSGVMTPYALMLRALDSPRYERVRVSPADLQ